MKSITITIPHDLGRAGARARIQGGFGQLRQQFAAAGVKDFEESWAGDTLNFSARGMGQKIAGRMDVRDKDVLIDIELPWLLGALAEKIKGGVEKQGRIMLEHKPAKT